MWSISEAGAWRVAQPVGMIEASRSTQEARPKIRVAVLNTHPIQYFAPLYRYITDNAAEIDLTALYCSDYSLRGAVDTGFSRVVTWDVDLLEGYKHRYLGARATKRTPRGFWSLWVPEIWSELRRERYDVLWLHGYGYIVCWLALLAAKSSGTKVMFRGETHMSLIRPNWRRRIRDAVLRRVFRSIDAFLAIGSRNRDYYLAMGVAPEKIHLVPYSVDNDRFISAARISGAERLGIRVEMGFDADIPVILYASKSIPRKYPDTLVRAVTALQARGKRLGLCMVGSGPMDAELKSLAESLGTRDMKFRGFVNQSELPRVYAACDVFVLAAESEPWGLVVNEVMCAALPVIITPDVGCAEDLVIDGGNGRKVPAGNVDALAAAIDSIIQSPDVRRDMGSRSRDRILQWGYRECVQGLLLATKQISAPQ